MSELGRLIRRAREYDNFNAALGNDYKDQLNKKERDLLIQTINDFETGRTHRFPARLNAARVILGRLMHQHLLEQK